MAHLNILNISRELSRLSENVRTISSDSNTMNISINDLNEIKINKIDIIRIIDDIKTDIQKMDHKINDINKEVNVLVNRDMDIVNKNTKGFSFFLINNLNLSTKKINIIIFVLECNNQQDFLMLNFNDVSHFDFTEEEFNLIHNKCREYLENPDNFNTT